LQLLAACVTVNVRPAIVSVPVRCELLVLGATLKLTEPPPEPVAPPVTVIHDALLTPVQVHPDVVVTVDVPVPPPSSTDWLDGEIEKAHAAPACVTANVWPAIETVPVRDCVVLLAVTLTPTVPLPLPLAPLVTVSQAV
jgi:hypothetical protein